MQWVLVWLWAGASGLLAAPKTKATLLLAAETAKPGDTVLAGVRLEMPAGYHTYWRYGGEAGMPTTIDWTLPKGITAGEIQWPVPEKYEAEGLYSYVYHDEAILLVPLKLAADLPAGPLTLKAKVAWLECEVACVPGEAQVSAPLTIGAETTPSKNAATLEAAKQRIPSNDPAKVTAAWGEPGKDGRPLTIEWAAGPGLKAPEFFPLPDDTFEVAGATEVLPAAEGQLKLRKLVKKSEKHPWPAKINGVLAAQAADGSIKAVSVTLTLGQPSGQPAPGSATPPAVSESKPAEKLTLGVLLLKLAAALVGGVILNFMPCVLPVISLKILGFVNQSQSDPRRVRRLGLIYGGGVLLSFLVLGGVVLTAKLLGQSVSWGMQLQSVPFVVAMMVVMTLIGLNLFGVFEVLLGGGVMNAAGSLAAREGAAGAFFNGVLATVLATACTAPVLGAAVGFAFSQSPVLIVPFFLTIGLGMAGPYVLLSWNPAWLKYLPKPGVWMEQFKKVMGFPMLATAIWLLSLAAEGLGQGSALWLGILLLLVGFGAWIWGEFVQRGGKRGAMLILAVLIGLCGWLLEGKLRWRHPPEPPAAGGSEIIQLHPGGIEWRRWSPAAVAAARAEGRPVLVDFTASWCLTCQVNAKTSLEIESVKAKLKAINAVALLENSFKKNAQVVAELSRHGRAGVPLVLVYPKDPAQPPLVLPELLTPAIVLEALDQAAR